MAIIRLEYLEHLRGIFRQMLLSDNTLIYELARSGLTYVKNGSNGVERNNRREALRILLTLSWRFLDRGPHDAHALRHLLCEAGINYADTEDIPETGEPLI